MALLLVYRSPLHYFCLSFSFSLYTEWVCVSCECMDSLKIKQTTERNFFQQTDVIYGVYCLVKRPEKYTHVCAHTLKFILLCTCTLYVGNACLLLAHAYRHSTDIYWSEINTGKVNNHSKSSNNRNVENKIIQNNAQNIKWYGKNPLLTHNYIDVLFFRMWHLNRTKLLAMQNDTVRERKNEIERERERLEDSHQRQSSRYCCWWCAYYNTVIDPQANFMAATAFHIVFSHSMAFSFFQMAIEAESMQAKLFSNHVHKWWSQFSIKLTWLISMYVGRDVSNESEHSNSTVHQIICFTFRPQVCFR